MVSANQSALSQNSLTRSFRWRAPLAAFLVSLATLSAAAPVAAEEGIGGARMVVNLVKGDLATGDKVNVVLGDEVFRDEGVKTDAASSARLILRDNTNLLLGPSSSIKLDRFVYAGPSQPGAIAVNLVKGALRFATGDADKKAYVIETPTATMGVRGTVLKILAYGSAKTLVVLDEGGAAVCARASKKHCLQLTEPGQGVAVTATQVKWDPGAAATVGAVIAAIPDVTQSAATGGGGVTAAVAVGAAANNNGGDGGSGSGSGGGDGSGGVGNGQGNGNGHGVGEGGNNGHGH
jgi:hypothetical protein